MEDLHDGCETRAEFRERHKVVPNQTTAEYIKWSDENRRLDEITFAAWERRRAARKKELEKTGAEISARVKAHLAAGKSGHNPTLVSDYDNGQVIDLSQNQEGTFS